MSNAFDFTDIGTKEDAPLDLTVTVYDGNYHNISNMWADRNAQESTNRGPHMNGFMGDRAFGNINLQYYHGDPNSGEGHFEFCLVDSGTNDPVVVPSFGFTVFDLDERGNDNGSNGVGLKEKLSFDTAQAYNYSIFPNFAESEVKPICENGDDITCTDNQCSGVHPGQASCPANVRTVFRSSATGGLGDNPTTPFALSLLQRKRSVYFLFENTSCFRFAFAVYCPLEPPHNAVPPVNRNLAYISDLSGCRSGENKHPYGGGNFLFAGESDALFVDPGCPTMSPSREPTPVPTEHQTPAPTEQPTPAPTEQPTPAPTEQPTPEPTPVPAPEPTHEPTEQPTPAPTQEPTPAPTPFPTISTGQCPIPGGTGPTGTSGQVYGLMKFCVRSSLGYRYGASNDFKEVNFIESLITIKYNLDAGFCVSSFNVEPKERVETTVQEDAYNLQAWLCDKNEMESFTNPVRSLPKRVTKYDTNGGTDYYNQGALITVCVSPDNLAYTEGIRMSSLDEFKWVRDEYTGLPGKKVEQTAIESSGPASNFLTYFDSPACFGAEWCSFSSILFADFYVNTGSVAGSGNATLMFDGTRRRLEEGRQLQEGTSSTFDLTLGVNGIDDSPYKLKTTGALSLGLSALSCLASLLFCSAILM